MSETVALFRSSANKWIHRRGTLGTKAVPVELPPELATFQLRIQSKHNYLAPRSLSAAAFARLSERLGIERASLRLRHSRARRQL
ncbi:Hypothetical predicted protein [Podarcis lilfordi]|uniref:Uncharacterized protein n=1 Tax=Podarcis lilfordi TaxID=74358 RepID=A0AA35PCQ2_9SAUR|nr:Hypothetical predicted protein [Podarcis lilfordi]